MTKTLPPRIYFYMRVLYQELLKRWVVILRVDFFLIYLADVS